MLFVIISIILYILFLIVIITGFFRKRYHTFLPTLPVYPNSYKEIKLVEKAINNRTVNDIEFFKFTDNSPHEPFLYHVDLPEKEVFKLMKEKDHILYFLKFIINRPRPKQINNNLDILKSKTADTAAFPAGHAFQAYYLAKKLGKKYKDKKKVFEKIAKECDETRVKAGLHYPSDGKFSKYLVDLLF